MSQVFVLVGAVAFASLLNAAVALAADTTRPTKPLVTDDGTYTALATSLHATWTTSTDPESGVVEYQYQIRQDATTGAIIADWTSTRTSTSVTRTGLNLPNGKKYFFAVKARNGAGLWSFIGYSNGITVDTTAPSVPGAPTEGSTADLDYDSDGAYPVYWPAAADAETGVVAYELQERVGTSGAWTTLTNTSTTRSFAVTNRQQASRYFYQVRAKNGAGLWGAYSATSDGILVDKTAPATPTVTDDGAYTGTSTSLHASWSASDPESGLAEFQYQIRRDSIAGTLIVNWISTSTTTSVTRTGLSLVNGLTYYVLVKAKNGAGTWSAVGNADGITVDTTAPAAVTVTDDGATTISTTHLHASWTASSDSESGIMQYEYLIRQDKGEIILRRTLP